MSAQHTPGEWTLTHGQNYNHLRNNETGRYVARFPDDAQGVADATLAAAAPAMLQALGMAQYCMDPKNADIVSDEDRKRANKAIAPAIAQATRTT